jgi:hypothetical protein
MRAASSCGSTSPALQVVRLELAGLTHAPDDRMAKYTWDFLKKFKRTGAHEKFKRTGAHAALPSLPPANASAAATPAAASAAGPMAAPVALTAAVVAAVALCL